MKKKLPVSYSCLITSDIVTVHTKKLYNKINRWLRRWVKGSIAFYQYLTIKLILKYRWQIITI